MLANGKCDVLKGQSIRSNAGLYYDGATEFTETLRAIEQNRWLSAILGRNGRQFFREQYDWPVIERKYLEMLERLSKEPAPGAIDPLPGWLDRRRRECPPGADVVAALPVGPHLRDEAAPPSRPEPSTRAPIPRPEAQGQHRRDHQRLRPRGGTPRQGSV